MSAGLHFSACPNCHSSDIHLWARTTGDGRLHETQWGCAVCRLVFANPQADEETMRLYYTEAYNKEAAEDYLDERSLHMRHEDKINRLKRLCPDGALLDIGAGNGSFLIASSNVGYRVTGIEPDRTFVKRIRERMGMESVIEGVFEQTRFPDGSFDIIYAWHVIEHVPDLGFFLNEIHRILRPEGILLLGTEGYQHTQCRLERFKARRAGVIPPFVSSHEHTYLFSKHSLRHCLTGHGFTIEHLRAYHNPLAYRLRFLTFRSTLSRVAMPIREWRFIVTHGIDRLLGAGDRLEAYARKT